MRTKLNDDLALADGEPHAPERTCVLSRRKGTKDELIRLGLGPEGVGRAGRPGSGRRPVAPWIGVRRAELRPPTPRASSRRRSSAPSRPMAVQVPTDLGERIEAVLSTLGGATASAWKLALATSSTARSASRPRPDPVKVHVPPLRRGRLLGRPPHSSRHGASARRVRTPKFGAFPRGAHYLVVALRPR